MKKVLLLISAMICVFASYAQTTVTVSDTIVLTVDSILPELDHNQHTYTYSFWGMDNTNKRQKVQIEYTGQSQYGTFTNDDFYNWDGSLGTGTYNYIRRADSDLGFYAFRNELTASVVDSLGSTIIDVNGLINVYGSWKRVLLHGEIAAPAPDDTIYADLGVVSTIPNSFYEYLILTAANDDYSLAAGLMNMSALAEGHYYMADMLRPDFVTAAGDTILPQSAELVVTKADAATFNLEMTLLGADNILYILTMHTGVVEITDTVSVACQSGRLTYSEVYNMYQFYGENNNYVIALAVDSAALTGRVTTIPSDHIMLTFSTVGIKATRVSTRVFDATASLSYDGQDSTRITLTGDLWGTDGVLYQVTIPIGWSVMPDALDTVHVNCGEGVLRVDYSRGIGFVGLVLGNVNENTFANVVFYNAMKLSGTYYNEDFDYSAEPGMYVQTLVSEGTNHMNRLHDIKFAQMQIDSVGTSLHITLDALTLGDTLYQFTATMSAKKALTGDEQHYDVSFSDSCVMVALQSKYPSTQEQIYQLQIQREDSLDADGMLVGDAEYWSFYFAQEAWDGISGTFGYSEGNLSDMMMHMVYEDGVEIYLSPVAGTVTFQPTQNVSVNLDPFTTYKTRFYTVSAQFVAENGITYYLDGENILLCIDSESGAFVQLTEAAWTDIEQTLEKQGLRVKKVLRGGMILLETKQGTFDLGGRKR